MAALFPHIDQCRRLETLLKRSLHRRTCGAAIQEAHGVWQTSLQAQQHAIENCHHLLKCVVVELIGALRANSTSGHDLFKLRVHVAFLRDIASVSSCIKWNMQQLGALVAVTTAQQCFSSYTSGWNLCEELEKLLSSHSPFAIEQKYDLVTSYKANWSFEGTVAHSRKHNDGEETCSLTSAYTTATVPASVISFKHKTPHFLQPIQEETKVPNQNPMIPTPGNKFCLQTLEEHRFATRFQPKRVTAKTWRKAQREAMQLLRTGDRIKLSEALYLLLEIAWLGPAGAPLARNYANIGSVYLTFDHLEEAAKAYRHCIQINPNHWKARHNLGVTLARLGDYVDANKQLRAVISPGYCPVPEIVDQARLILHEIEELQLTRNKKAFKQAAKPRVFTAQFLQTLHNITATDAPIVPFGPSLTQPQSLPPVLFARPEGWKGAIASLVHRLHVLAWCRGYSINDVFSAVDPERKGVSIKIFDRVLKEITGAGLSQQERREICHIFDARSIAVHYLTPGLETQSTIAELHRVGTFRSAIDWRLTRRRPTWCASSQTNQSSFRYWLELPMNCWVQQVLSHSTGTAALSTALDVFVDELREHDWLSPFDFGLEYRSLPQPHELSKLSFADRGALVFESHRARSSIQHEASIVIQMQTRRHFVALRVDNRKREASSKHRLEKSSARQTLLVSVVEKDVTRLVTDAVSDIVDAVVRLGVAELLALETGLSASSDFPVRTELRLRHSEQ